MVQSNDPHILRCGEAPMSKQDIDQKIATSSISLVTFCNILPCTTETANHDIFAFMKKQLLKEDPLTPPEGVKRSGQQVVAPGQTAKYWEYPATDSWKSRINILKERTKRAYPQFFPDVRQQSIVTNVIGQNEDGSDITETVYKPDSVAMDKVLYIMFRKLAKELQDKPSQRDPEQWRAADKRTPRRKPAMTVAANENKRKAKAGTIKGREIFAKNMVYPRKRDRTITIKSLVDDDTRDVMLDFNRMPNREEDYQADEFEFELLMRRLKEHYDMEGMMVLVEKNPAPEAEEGEYVEPYHQMPRQGFNSTDTWQLVVQMWKNIVKHDKSFVMRVEVWPAVMREDGTFLEYDDEDPPSDEDVFLE